MAQEMRGRFVIDTSNQSVGVDTQTFTLTTGNYFIDGHEGEGENSLVGHFQTLLRTCTSQGDSNCLYVRPTGGVNIQLETSANIAFDAALANILGFQEPGYVAAAVHTGEQNCRYTWRPSVGMSSYPVEIWKFFAPRSSTIVGRSIDGTSFTVAGTTTYDARIEFRYLPESEVVTPQTGYKYLDLQQFFEDVVAAGQPIRFLTNRLSNEVVEYVNVIWGDEEEDEIGSFTDYMGREVSNYQGLWSVEIPLFKKV